MLNNLGVVAISVSALLLGCGGGQDGPAGDDGGGQDGPIGNNGGGSDGTVPPEIGGGTWPPPACDEAGVRRDASAGEMSQYCICTAIGGALTWECYGPSPTSVPPTTACSFQTVNPGTGDGNCYVSWEKCTDGQVYAVDCVDSNCQCTVQGVPTVLLPPTMKTCPESKTGLNSLCGWNLQ
jgi:hypothetical protein